MFRNRIGLKSRETVGPSCAPTSAITTGSPSNSRSITLISRDSSQPFTNPAAARSASGLEVSYVISRSARTRSSMSGQG